MGRSVAAMAGRRVAGVIGAAIFALAALMAVPSPVAAECTGFDTWPSFREAARSAERIIVGRVVAAYDYYSDDIALRFRFEVDEVLRGASPRVIEFRQAIHHPSFPAACIDSLVRVRVGDVIAFAYSPAAGRWSQGITTLAYLSRSRRTLPFMPGVERLSRAEVRRLAALPRTDTVPMPASTPTPLGVLAVTGLAGLLAGLLKARVGRADRTE